MTPDQIALLIAATGAGVALCLRAFAKWTEARATLTIAQATSLTTDTEMRKQMMVVMTGQIANNTKMTLLEVQNDAASDRIKTLLITIEELKADVAAGNEKINKLETLLIQANASLEIVTTQLRTANDQISDMIHQRDVARNPSDTTAADAMLVINKAADAASAEPAKVETAL
jgi:enamine deaminase RidA (YjgF/YER057c/UK114 family)